MIAISFKFKARPNARNISTQHLTKFLNRVAICCEGHPKLLQQKFDHFQTWSNTIQYIATCCYRLAKRVQHIARNNVAGCCVEKLHALEFRKNLKTFYNNVVHFMCLFRQTAACLVQCKVHLVKSPAIWWVSLFFWSWFRLALPSHVKCL